MLFNFKPQTLNLELRFGEIAKWSKATDCKSVLFGVPRFKSLSPHRIFYAEVAQLVERQPSKLQVAGSSLVFRSVKKLIVNRNSRLTIN